MSLLDGITDERAKALVTELSLNQLCGLVFAKALLTGERVNIRIRPAEARVNLRKAKRPAKEGA